MTEPNPLSFGNVMIFMAPFIANIAIFFWLSQTNNKYNKSIVRWLVGCAIALPTFLSALLVVIGATGLATQINLMGHFSIDWSEWVKILALVILNVSACGLGLRTAYIEYERTKTARGY